MITLFFSYERSEDGEGQQSLIHHQGGGWRRRRRRRRSLLYYHAMNQSLSNNWEI
jgi:hypothetical protein